jgi:predicted GTPase
MEKNDIFKNLEDDVNQSPLSDEVKSKMYQNIRKLKQEKINLMITGATGSGKSSTINALFDLEVAKVGTGVDPETMDIQKFDLDNLVLWDSPGLGDGKEKDIEHSKGIIKKLNELDDNNKRLIDMVLVLLDGSSRDLGTSYELINSVIIPNLGENAEKRIIVAINQADVAMKGKYWNDERNIPEKELAIFLNDKVESVRKRIKEATGLSIEPIYYSAGYKDGNNKQNPYNLSKLLYLIVKNTPTKKRLAYANSISNDKNMWESSRQRRPIFAATFCSGVRLTAYIRKRNRQIEARSAHIKKV